MDRSATNLFIPLTRSHGRTSTGVRIHDASRHWDTISLLTAALIAIASPPSPADSAEFSYGLPAATPRDSLSTPIVTLRIRFDDGTPPANVRHIRFLRDRNSETDIGEAILTGDPSVAVIGRPSHETRWVKIYADAPYPEFQFPENLPPERNALGSMAHYDCFLPFDASNITTNTERALILPRGNASLRVRLLPPAGGDDAQLAASLETVWQEGHPSMIMPGRPQDDGTFLFAPVWPGIYYVYVYCDGASYRRPVAIQDGESRDEGEWSWPDGRIRGRLLDAAGNPRANELLHFVLAETDGFDLSALGSIPLQAAAVRTDADGRFECRGLLPGLYLPMTAPLYRWDDKEIDPYPWPLTTPEWVFTEDDSASMIALRLKRSEPGSGRVYPTPLEAYDYDPTNGTVTHCADIWTVKQ